MALRTAEFLLQLPLQPKERPRFGNGRTYKSSGYREWTKQCRSVLSEWWTVPPLGKGQIVAVQFTFKGPGTSDLDNLQGAVMDAGKGIVWTDDRVTVLRRIEAEWEKAPKTEQSINLKVIFNDESIPAVKQTTLQ